MTIRENRQECKRRKKSNQSHILTSKSQKNLHQCNRYKTAVPYHNLTNISTQLFPNSNNQAKHHGTSQIHYTTNNE